MTDSKEAKLKRRVYLDVCALGRPFDDQRQARIRLETSAVDLILSHVRQGKITLVVSSVHDEEIKADPDINRQKHLIALLSRLGVQLSIDSIAARSRAGDLVKGGLGIADAAHISVAEQLKAEFITVDDRLIKRYNRSGPIVWCGSPLDYCSKENLK
jgi:predicted nucleic acid-binding protein